MDLSVEDAETTEEQRLRSAKELVEVTGASLNEILEYREIFELVDTDKGGSIDAEELRKLVDLLNMDTSEDELDEMMKEIDTTGEGEIFFPDFVRCMLTKPRIDYTIDDVTTAFQTLAGNEYPLGYIPHELLEEQLMTIPGQNITKEKCDDPRSRRGDACIL